jgi:hypothetical protein
MIPSPGNYFSGAACCSYSRTDCSDASLGQTELLSLCYFRELFILDIMFIKPLKLNKVARILSL